MIGSLAASGVLVAGLIQAALGGEGVWGNVPGRLRLKASFETTPPRADVSAGEPRMTRIWTGRDHDRRPDDGSKGRVSLEKCLVSGRAGGRAFSPATDVAFRAVGNMNPDRGTFAAWFRRSEVFQKGGMLLSAKSFVSGGGRGTEHWGLGVRPLRGDATVNQRLFVLTAGGTTRAPLPPDAGQWLHVAAVWDADHGAKLYVDGTSVTLLRDSHEGQLAEI